jgi:large subunit ribosomal protein L21
MATKEKTNTDSFAVIETGGKQYTVAVGDELEVETLEGDVGDEITLPTMLLSDEGDVSVGTPDLDTAVTAEILEHGRGEKIEVMKFKRKKGYMRRYGHRQNYTKLKIIKIF